MISEVSPRSRKRDADYWPLPEEENLVRKDPQQSLVFYASGSPEGPPAPLGLWGSYLPRCMPCSLYMGPNSLEEHPVYIFWVRTVWRSLLSICPESERCGGASCLHILGPNSLEEPPVSICWVLIGAASCLNLLGPNNLGENLVFVFYCEDQGNRFFQNAGIHLPIYKASHYNRP
jgi:hypothetical protein